MYVHRCTIMTEKDVNAIDHHLQIMQMSLDFLKNLLQHLKETKEPYKGTWFEGVARLVENVFYDHHDMTLGEFHKWRQFSAECIGFTKIEKLGKLVDAVTIKLTVKSLAKTSLPEKNIITLSENDILQMDLYHPQNWPQEPKK